MKTIKPILAGLFIIMLFSSGCRENTNRNTGVDVIISGDGDFPESLAGRWKADKGGWEIEFDSEGSISSAIISFGRIEVVPGQTTTVPMKLGGTGVVEPDVWVVQYEPSSRELAVDINIRNYRMELGGNIVEGQLKDLLIGTVSKDGKSWKADWFSFSEYIVSTSKHDKYKLPKDEDSEFRGEVVFTKVSEKK